jgi:hypothetical protein
MSNAPIIHFYDGPMKVGPHKKKNFEKGPSQLFNRINNMFCLVLNVSQIFQTTFLPLRSLLSLNNPQNSEMNFYFVKI